MKNVVMAAECVRPADLVVLVHDPVTLARWLSADTTMSTVLARRARFEPLEGYFDGVTGMTNVDDSGWDFVRIPLDGPVEAFATVLRGIRAQMLHRAGHTCVLVGQASPPAPSVLTTIAELGMTPAVDLTDVAWVTDGAVLIGGRGGAGLLPYDLQADGHSRALAEVVEALAIAPDRSTMASWFAGEAARGGSTDVTAWSWALAALYIEGAAAVLRTVRQRQSLSGAGR